MKGKNSTHIRISTETKKLIDEIKDLYPKIFEEKNKFKTHDDVLKEVLTVMRYDILEKFKTVSILIWKK